MFTSKSNNLVLNLFRCLVGNDMGCTRKVYKSFDAFLFKTCNVFIRGWSGYTVLKAELLNGPLNGLVVHNKAYTFVHN